MKKIFVVLTLFTALFFAVSCDELKFKPYDGNSETSQNDSDDIETSDADMSDNDSGNTDSGSDSGDTEPNENNSDDDSGDSVPDESDSDDDYPDDGDTTPDEGDSTTDESDTTPDDDDTDPVQTNPCDPNPCLDVANSTKECIETGDTTYSCKCNSGFNWIENQCRSNSTPSLPECSTSTTTFPCKDLTTNYIWSERYGQMDWQPAVDKCTSLNSSNYGGYSSGWHLPTIDELKTLITVPSGTPRTAQCQVSETNGYLSSSYWTCETCTESCTQSSSGTSCDCNYHSDGRFSKLGDGEVYLWSSSTLSDNTNSAWIVYFGYGYVYYFNEDFNYYYVRCVR